MISYVGNKFGYSRMFNGFIRVIKVYIYMLSFISISISISILSIYIYIYTHIFASYMLYLLLLHIFTWSFHLTRGYISLLFSDSCGSNTLKITVKLFFLISHMCVCLNMANPMLYTINHPQGNTVLNGLYNYHPQRIVLFF